ncbi:MAG: hypothetical protein OZ948_17900 [Deltaproteobacteria bacterium]|nr:hypothetical protein [Deltaproteobacteria bacterium]
MTNGKRTLLLACAVLAASGLGFGRCRDGAAILHPRDGAVLEHAGDVRVVIALGPPRVPTPPFEVSLRAGSGPATDVTDQFTVHGPLAKARLRSGLLGQGPHTLLLDADLDRDGVPETHREARFTYRPGFRAAACARRITPIAGVNHSDPVYIAGFDQNRPATGVHDDTWARGVVLEDAGIKLALVTLDVVGYFHNEVLAARSLVDPALGFDAIFVTSTHTHESADTLGLWGPNLFTPGVDFGYLDFVNQQIADCVSEASTRLTPAKIKFATGSTRGASLPPHPDLVRDTKILEALTIDLAPIGREGTIVVQGDDGQEFTNPTVPSFQIRERREHGAHGRRRGARAPGPGPHPEREVIATLVNFASHPEALGGDNTLVSSDFPHYTREVLEARYGGTAIHMSADVGVLQSPRVDLADPANPGHEIPYNTFAFAERMGTLLAERAAEALDASHDWLGAPEIELRTVAPVQVPIENPGMALLGGFGLLGRRRVTPAPGQGPFDVAFLSEVHVLRIGPAQVVLTPNELDPQIGDGYRALMTRAEHRFVAGLANDELGYQMPEEKFNPTCFLCFAEAVLGDPESCPLFDTLDCGTVFLNNIGPGTDPLFRGLLEPLLEETNE